MTGDITTTRSGTKFKNSVEYSTYPPPKELVKAMERRWAEEFLQKGAMRFHNPATYRAWENIILGDPNDGQGMFRMAGHSYHTSSTNPVYAWCASMPTITPERTLQLARYGKYDCVIRVHEPLLLIERVQAALMKAKNKLHLHCAEVSYNRGAEVDKQALSSQKFHFNVFQKDPDFAPDMEYRLSLTDTSPQSQQKPYVDIEVGVCSDIMSIETLPNNAK